MVRLIESLSQSIPKWLSKDRHGRTRRSVLDILNRVYKVDLNKCNFISSDIPNSRNSIMKDKSGRYIPVFLLLSDDIYIPGVRDVYVSEYNKTTDKLSWSKILNVTQAFGYIDTADGKSLKSKDPSFDRKDYDHAIDTGDTTISKRLSDDTLLFNRSIDKSGYLIRTAKYWTDRLYSIDSINADSVAKICERLTRKVKDLANNISNILDSDRLIVEDSLSRDIITRLSIDYEYIIYNYQKIINRCKRLVDKVSNKNDPRYEKEVARSIIDDVSEVVEYISKANQLVSKIIK